MGGRKSAGFARGGFHQNEKCLAFRRDARMVEVRHARHSLDESELIHLGANAPLYSAPISP
jgi:hypothetical protein